MKKLEEIFTALGLNQNNGLFITNENNSQWKKETSFPNRVQRLIDKELKPDAFFSFDNKPLLLFFDNPTDKERLHKVIWNFNESPVAIIVEKDTIEILNGFKFEKENKRLQLFGKEDKLNDFTYFQLVTGRTWEQYQGHLNFKNRVDYYLLQNIKTVRNILIERHKGSDYGAKIINSILGKCIFARYLIDRNVKINIDNTIRTWSNSEFCALLDNRQSIENFFKQLEDSEKGFNGDLFPLSSEDYKRLSSNDYQLIKKLLSGQNIETGQSSLFEFYDFSIIPIEFISNVYELFIGEENQKETGAYYTPLFLVDYILNETVEKKLSSKKGDFNCKVLDPACGSGIFLVETLRKIIEKYIAEKEINKASEEFRETIKQLARNNIFGIDRDMSAVQVAIFSIYLTLLDYLEPPDITTFKFPSLLNSNFFNADFFDDIDSYNNKLHEVEMNFIVGNPPWKGHGITKKGAQYLKKRKTKEFHLNKRFEIAINNGEIAEGFVLRVSDFCSTSTKISFIIRSSCLYNLGYNNEQSPFRQYWLSEFYIDKIIELASVRKEVFEKSNQPAVAPAAVIFYRYANGNVTDNNIVEHISLKKSRFFTLFKVFTLNRADFKRVQQSKLKQFDWLWKVLVYGSYLDFNFIKRVKEEFLTIGSVISDKQKFSYGTGIQYSSTAKYSSNHLIGMPFLDVRGVDSFFIDPRKISPFDKEKLHRIRADKGIFKSPMLLMRKGLDMDSLTIKCAIAKKDLLFKDSLTSISIKSEDDIKALINILTVLSSNLLTYYAITTFGSIGIEREQTQNYNKFSLPYLELEVDENVNLIEEINFNVYNEKQQGLPNNIKIQSLEKQIEIELEKINNTIYSKLDLNELEISLIDYSLNVSRIMIIGSELEKNKLFSSIVYYDELLNEYASLFINRFKTKLETEKLKFVVEIWHSKQIIGMLFKMVPFSEYEDDIVWINKQNDTETLSFLAEMSSEKITEQLFILKDVRGFRVNDDQSNDYFYIFKPNEKRLWHKAIGYLDVEEFADAILKIGRDKK